MNTIDEHIKKNEFSNMYLLFGKEDYLKITYRNKLRKTIISPDDSMNYSYFEGKDIDETAVISMAGTVPFFSERRLIVVENSGLFKRQNELSEFLSSLPETTFLVFVEQEVDKRSKLYKAVQKSGTVVELNGLEEKDLKLWVATYLHQSQKKITEQNIMYMLNKTGADMQNLKNELDKLISYSASEDVITREMIDEICVAQTEGKIFEMIDAIGMRNQDRALQLYYDLLAVREKPMSILFLLIRHFNILIQLKELANEGAANGVIASKVGVPPFAVRKYIGQAKNFKNSEIRDCLEQCAEVEQQVKTGLLLDQIGVELLIIAFSRGRVSK
ncbi:MAG: DNA polymerase III subunit delta [Lachnospiraceae bacterium]|jgi:DNA polymerase-3 subunit delta|nr:DNA polymerase III subunit delta [Lachnospiraceae bacterium]